MAHRRMMGHTGWLVVFAFVYGFRSGLCDIFLTMEKTVTGYRRESVVIPCTYTASNNEDIIKIEWEFQSHLVIYRADEQDHIPLSMYRERAVISKSPSGDVSLTLRRLDMDDRGNFKCKVTGRDRNGKLITQEHVTILKVLRKKNESPDVDSGENDFWTTRPPTEQPKVTTAENEVTTKVLITTTPDVRVSTAGKGTFTEDNVSSSDEHEEIITTKIPHIVTEHFVTETPHMETEQTTRQDVKTRVFTTIIPDVKVSSVGKDPDLTTGGSSEGDSAIARTKQPGKFHPSSFPALSFTTHVMNNNPPAEAIKTGSGIFFYTLIIGLLCLVSVLIVTIVLIARRKKTKTSNYNLPTMNQLAASNNYEPDIPVCQYENLPMCSHEYEQLVQKNPEGNDSQCQSSK